MMLIDADAKDNGTMGPWKVKVGDLWASLRTFEIGNKNLCVFFFHPDSKPLRTDCLHEFYERMCT